MLGIYGTRIPVRVKNFRPASAGAPTHRLEPANASCPYNALLYIKLKKSQSPKQADKRKSQSS